MPAVSDTSPLLNLAIIGQLSLLHDQFGEIWIPAAVMEELRVQEDLPGSQEIKEALKAGWIQVHEVKDQALAQVLERDLDKGEAETIALAIQAKSVWTLLDEREARKIAKSLGLKVTGILGILLRARNEGTLPSLKKAMDQLQNLAGFYIGVELTISLLRESGEGD